MTTSLKTTLRKLYTYHALDDFVLLYPLYNVFMADHGLSIGQISSLLILWSLTDLATNIPAGVLADKYSRKTLLGVGQILKAAGFAIWYLWPHYLGFAAGFVLWGIGGALSGGTFEALVYDELRATGQERGYVKVIGRARSLALVANTAATALAGAAILLGYGFVYSVSIFVVLLSSLLVFTLPETPRFEEVADTRYFAMLRQGLRETIRNRTVLGLVVLGGFITAIYGSLEEYVPLLIRDTGTVRALIPLAVAATTAVAALGSFLAHRYEKLSTPVFMVLLAISGLALTISGHFPGLSLVIPIVLYTFLIKLLDTIYEGKLQHSITSGLRATITSAGGFATETLSLAVYGGYGLIAGASNNLGAFITFGAITALVALGYLLIAPRIVSNRTLHQLSADS